MKKPFVSLLIFCCFYLDGHSQAAGTLTIVRQEEAPTISRHIYGHFSEHLGRCIYDGFWADENLNVPKTDRIRMDIVDALKKLNIPNLRWPGGCFADEYHWSDGIGPRDQRPAMINTHWGMVVEDNSFGTHEFLELCELLGTEPYIAANVGSGTVREMNDWIEYVNFDGESALTTIRKENGHPDPWRVKYWGIGNESWGCGGNMTPEYFSGLYKQYATYARSYPGAPIRRIASGANSTDYHWTEVMMREALQHMWGLSVHYYTIPTGNWGNKGSATDFEEAEYFQAMKNALFMEELLDKHMAIMDKYDPEKKVALVVDEWGIWTDAEPGTRREFLFQQNSLRDALIAGTTLNIFNNRSDRIKMANLAQTVNVLQALILTEGEKMVLTPTYHIFDLFQVHQDAKWLSSSIEVPSYTDGDEKIKAVNVSASEDSTGTIHITLVNIDANNDIQIDGILDDFEWGSIQGKILTSAKVNDVNTFEGPQTVRIQDFKGVKKSKGKLIVDIPAKSVVLLALKP